jgi:hypothetical protein
MTDDLSARNLARRNELLKDFRDFGDEWAADRMIALEIRCAFLESALLEARTILKSLDAVLASTLNKPT